MSRGRHQRKRRLNKRFVLFVTIVVTAIIAIIVCVALLGGKDKDNQNDINEPPDNEHISDDIPDDPVTDPDTEEPGNTDDEPEDEPEVYDGPVNPLTGLPCDEDLSGERPCAVMINNIKVATPACGIGSADLIYETLAEGGLTRLMAVYQDITVVDTIGSVRSARPYFLDLAQGHDAIFIHAGGSDNAYIEIKNRGITNIDGVNGSGETFYRDSWRKSNMGYEHSLMLDTTLLETYYEKHKLRVDHNDGYESSLVFCDEPAISGSSAAEIKVTFSSAKSTSFSYDESTGLYMVSQYGGAMKDSGTGEQVSVRNVVILRASMSRISGDTAGRMTATFTGTGSGTFICDGVAADITWSKDSHSSQFEYTYSDGTPVEFGRGVTYFCIIPISGGSTEID